MTETRQALTYTDQIKQVLEQHLPGDYTHLFFDAPGEVEPKVACRCGWRRERGVSHHAHIATTLAAAATDAATKDTEALARVRALRDRWARMGGTAIDSEVREWLSAASSALRVALDPAPRTAHHEESAG